MTTDMRRLADEFVAAWNGKDIERLGRLFHPDFRWHIAVTDHGDPVIKPLQSKLLQGKNLQWSKAIYNREETLKIFGRIFDGVARFEVDLRSVIVEGERAALELVGSAVNEEKGRVYNNIYCYVFEGRDDQLVLFREYQDTLLLFDAWVAE